MMMGCFYWTWVRSSPGRVRNLGVVHKLRYRVFISYLILSPFTMNLGGGLVHKEYALNESWLLVEGMQRHRFRYWLWNFPPEGGLGNLSRKWRSWRSRRDLEVERVVLGSWAVVQFGRCGLGNCGAVGLRGSHSGRDGKLRTADSFIAQHTVFAQYS